jgi:hypothetical protein
VDRLESGDITRALEAWRTLWDRGMQRASACRRLVQRRGEGLRARTRERLLVTASLVVHALAPEQLLAMKLSAWRDDVDVDDARLLLSKLPGEREAVWRAVERHVVPGRELKAQYAFSDLWDADHAS